MHQSTGKRNTQWVITEARHCFLHDRSAGFWVLKIGTISCNETNLIDFFCCLTCFVLLLLAWVGLFLFTKKTIGSDILLATAVFMLVGVIWKQTSILNFTETCRANWSESLKFPILIFFLCWSFFIYFARMARLYRFISTQTKKHDPCLQDKENLTS